MTSRIWFELLWVTAFFLAYLGPYNSRLAFKRVAYNASQEGQ